MPTKTEKVPGIAKFRQQEQLRKARTNLRARTVISVVGNFFDWIWALETWIAPAPEFAETRSRVVRKKSDTSQAHLVTGRDWHLAQPPQPPAETVQTVEVVERESALRREARFSAT